MFDDLEDLYQQVIIDHGRNPRNQRELEDADAEAEGYNPLCGDRVHVYLKRDDDRVTEAAFTGTGCAICTASCSLMTQVVRGKSIGEVQALFERFHKMLTAEGESTEESDALGKLAVFAGVRKYPMRVKCATLPWHTIKAALETLDEVVSTET